MAVKYVKEFDYPSQGGFHKSKMPSRGMPNAPARGAARMESKPKVGKGQGYAVGGRVPGEEMDRLPVKNPPGRGKDLAPSKPERGQYQGYNKGGLSSVPSGRDQPGNIVLTSGTRGANGGVRTVSGKQPKLSAEMDRALRDAMMRRAAASRVAPSGGGQTVAYQPREAKQPYGPTVEITPSSEVASEYRSVSMPSSGYSKKYGVPRTTLKKGGKVGKVAKVMGEYKKGELHSGSKKGPVVKNPKQAIAIALSEARKAGAKIPKKGDGGGIYSDEYMAYGDKKGPYRGSPKKGKMLGRQDRRAREAMERAEKSAPGMSLDMPDRKYMGGMMRRKMK